LMVLLDVASCSRTALELAVRLLMDVTNSSMEVLEGSVVSACLSLGGILVGWWWDLAEKDGGTKEKDTLF
jgi:hypothetical protein